MPLIDSLSDVLYAYLVQQQHNSIVDKLVLFWDNKVAWSLLLSSPGLKSR